RFDHAGERCFLGLEDDGIRRHRFLVQVLAAGDVVETQDETAGRVVFGYEQPPTENALLALEVGGEVRHVRRHAVAAANGAGRADTVGVVHLHQVNVVVIAEDLRVAGQVALGPEHRAAHRIERGQAFHTQVFGDNDYVYLVEVN